MTPNLQFIILGICYLLLFLLCLLVWKWKSGNLLSLQVQNSSWLLLHLRHAGGIIFMAVIPGILIPGIYENSVSMPEEINLLQAIILSVSALLIIILVVRHRPHFPDENKVVHQHTSFQIGIHLVLRTSFLVCYEWFFRYCILFTCIETFGVIPAVIMNLGLYALIHSFNGKKEVLGSLPFGLMLCVFTIWTQSVWPAILLHGLLSSTYESFVLSALLKNKSETTI